MVPPVEITEVFRRADAGVSTRPFLCRGADGRNYYVKLGNALNAKILAEWVCGRLAQEMGLPIADFAQVRVSKNLWSHLPDEHWEIGHGVGFGSVACHPTARDFLSGDIARVGAAAFRELMVFDAWIRNEDRKLGEFGGNPNLMFDPSRERPLVMIDHDCAFDENFDASAFRAGHAGRDALGDCIDPAFRERWTKRASRAATRLDSIWAEFPEEWLEDIFGDAKPGLSLEDVRSLLELPERDPGSFWRTLSSQ